MPPGTKKTSVSLNPELVKWAEGRAKELGFEHSFSAYIALLIRRDREAMAAEELKESPIEYKLSKPPKNQPQVKLPHSKSQKADKN